MVNANIGFCDSVSRRKESSQSSDQIMPSFVHGRMRRQAGRLIDHDQVVVFKQNAGGRHLELPVARGGVGEKFREIDIGFDRRTRSEGFGSVPHWPSIQTNS